MPVLITVQYYASVNCNWWQLRSDYLRLVHTMRFFSVCLQCRKWIMCSHSAISSVWDALVCATSHTIRLHTHSVCLGLRFLESFQLVSLGWCSFSCMLLCFLRFANVVYLCQNKQIIRQICLHAEIIDAINDEMNLLIEKNDFSFYLQSGESKL